MTAPVGRKNLSPELHKASSADAVLVTVQELHPAAEVESLVDLLAYFVAGRNERRLVGLAWIDRSGSWSYVVQSRVAYDIGMRATLVQISGSRYRVLPARAEHSVTVQRQMRAQQLRAQRFARYSPDYERLRPRRFRQDDGWWIEFQVRNGVERRGPYPSTYALDTDLDRLLKELAGNP